MAMGLFALFNILAISSPAKAQVIQPVASKESFPNPSSPADLLLASQLPKELYQDLNAFQRGFLARLVRSHSFQTANMALCFAPDTPKEVIDQAYARIAPISAFRLNGRWTSTATDGGGLAQGDPTTLTFSFIPDGTLIQGFAGEPAAPSNLIAWLNGKYGSQNVWQPLFQQVFDRWAAISGTTYVFESNDDGATFGTTAGQLGFRGDVRIGGHLIDGNSGVLAYNFFPSSGGDMVFDTADNTYDNLANNSLILRNVIAHEHGHGLGFSHVCPISQTKLMEPFLATNFDGPQHDDFLAIHRSYGDRFENNDLPANATALGTLGAGNTTITNLSIDGASDRDVFSINTSVAGMTINLTLTPVGEAYLEGPQNSDGSCSAGTTFNSLSQNDLSVQLLDSNGSTVLTLANINPIGQPEQIFNFDLPRTTGPFFIEVFGSGVDNAQLYDISFTLSGGGVALPTVDIQNASVLEGNTGTTNMVFSLTISPALTSAGSLNFATADNSAQAGSDYTATSGSLPLPIGASSATIAVPVIGDTVIEQTETFFLNLSAPNGVILNTNQAIGTIFEDDSPLRLSINDVSVTEGDTGTRSATFSVFLNQSTNVTVSVNYATIDVTAQAGSDYVATQGTLTFNSGVTNQTLTVQVNGDLNLETTEFFDVLLSNPVNAGIQDPSGRCTIIDDDSIPANDRCDGAIVIASQPFNYNQSTLKATSGGDPAPTCITTLGRGVWFQYTAGINGILTVDTTGSDFDTGLAIYTNSCAAPIEVGCDDDSGQGTTSRVQLNVIAGDSFLILAGGKGGAGGSLNLTLSVEAAPPRLTSFTPAVQDVDGVVLIDGINFSENLNDNIVYFGAVQAQVLSATTTQLQVKVPAGASYAPITVAVGGKLAMFNHPFSTKFPTNQPLTANTFSNKVQFSTGNSPKAMVLADWNLDGRADVALANSGENTISILRNGASTGSLSSGTLIPTLSLSTGSSPTALAAGDLDGDGRLDLAVVNAISATVQIFRNTSVGSISFASAVTISTGVNPSAVALADLDADGLLELLVTEEGTSRLAVYANQSQVGQLDANSFASPVRFVVGSGPVSVVAGDLNGDGFVDVAVANGFNGPGGNSITLLENLSSTNGISLATFGPRVTLPTQASPYQLLLTDVDSANGPDLALSSSSSSDVQFFLNQGGAPATLTTNRFDSPVTVSAGIGVRGFGFGDVSGDGKPEMVVANLASGSLTIHLNQSSPGSLSFASFLSIPATSPVSALVGDLDRNGKAELIALQFSGGITVYQNRLKLDPIISWPQPSPIFYGTPLSGTQLNASANVSGVFQYSPTAGTVLNAGNGQTISLVFIPLDTQGYNIVTQAVTLHVTTKLLQVQIDTLERPVGFDNPTPTGSITGAVNNDVFQLQLSVSADSQSPVGIYPIQATLLDPGNRIGNYLLQQQNGNLIVTPRIVTVSGGGSSNLTTSFIGQAGTFYLIQVSTNLVSWNDAGSFIATGNEQEVLNQVIQSTGNQFFRIVASPPASLQLP